MFICETSIIIIIILICQKLGSVEPVQQKLKLPSSYMLIDMENSHALMFKALKSIYIFEPTNKFIYEDICIDL